MDKRLLGGVLIMALGMILIPVGDSLAKYIASITPYSAGFLSWSRFAVGIVLIAPLALWKKSFRQLGKTFYFKQAIRGFFIATTITLIITAVSLSPLPDVFGAFFIGPALSVVFAVVFLKEKASLLEWIAVLLGFVGVLLVLQPGATMSYGLLWALGAGVFYGAFLTATRWAAQSGPPIAQLTAQLFFGFLFTLPLASADIISHGLQAPAPVLLMGVSSAVANYCSILALARARPAYLAPVVYLQIVAATIIGLLFFDDTINLLAGAGLALIVFTGLLRIPLPNSFRKNSQ